jgi:hypothetical protein
MVTGDRGGRGRAGGGVTSLRWRAGLDRWIADVAAAVYADVPLIGFKIDEAVTSPENVDSLLSWPREQKAWGTASTAQPTLEAPPPTLPFSPFLMLSL